MAKPRTRLRRVSEWDLRNKFNREKYLERLEKGEFVAEVIADAHPSFPLANEPECTHSQRLAYCDPVSGRHMAEVHRYLRKDNTLGGSGQPDPKMIREGDVLLILDKSQSDW